ncbi:MAG TPA: bifunctional acetate--CoA ligase family protein/GNAT family N-acetyltransferase [Rhizomicrobium sp.]|nr:bifunctional acetate--CoA ligase family protein/GNAT family N-acetyltransferase [Rhizomicrobium sp.]
MTVRNLDAIFHPANVALIGASDRPHSVGAVILDNLRGGGFAGAIYPVNPHHAALAGLPCYPGVAGLPEAPDLAIICTPPAAVPGLVAELGARGTRGAIVITAGFREGGNAAGQALQQAMLDAARPHLLRIVGPNCVGVLTTPSSLNASFAPGTPRAGGVAFVAQSGAMVTSVLDWATGRGIGFSHMVSLGDMSDVDFGDVLDYLAGDANTMAILLYIEAVTQARKFLSAARAASRLKPVIAIKAGRQPAAAKAATSHTGALAGMDAVYDAAFERAGILRAYDLDEIFDAVETLATHPRIGGDRLVIVTNGGGAGVLATDALMSMGGELATLSPASVEKLDAALPPTWSHGNPVDIIGDADGARYGRALEALVAEPGADAVLVLNCPVAVASGTDAAKAVVAGAARLGKPVLTNWLGAEAARAPRALFEAAGIPTYETPEKAVRGFMHIVRYHRGQRTLMEVPPSQPGGFSPDLARAKSIVAGHRGEAPAWLDPLDVQALLACYGIPVPRIATAATAREAAHRAQAFGAPVALKILSPDITHKSDIGGVALRLEGAAVEAAAAAMLVRVREAAPGARLDGFYVQEMIERPGAFELIMGMAQDATFGPFLLFGQGGTAVEVIDDKALGLPPLNLKLAHEMIARTRVSRQLAGYRDHAPVRLDDVALTLVRLSQMICDFGEIAELDINPLLADARGVVALDARIRIAPARGDPAARLAIKPYPQALESDASGPGHEGYRFRPIRPEDAPAIAAFAARVTPEDTRMRFFTPFKTLPRTLLARLTQIDYDREMAFVLFDERDAVAGVSRLAADPDGVRAEFAVIVRSDLKHRGLGRLLMDRLIAYARRRGIAEIFGDVLAENGAMLALCRDLGCALGTPSAGIVRATLPLVGRTARA